MIKKTIILILCFVLFLSGCSGYREADNCYIVTAVGFDVGKKIKATVEVVSAGGSERKEKPTSEILTGEGKSVREAIYSLNSKISKYLMFDHCTAILLSENLSEDNFSDILEYGKQLKELNFAVFMTSCDNAKKLLKDSSPESVARGFDIAGNIKEIKKETGINYENKFYETYKAFNEEEIFSLPYLKISQKRIIIDGEIIMKGHKRTAFLSNEESLVYSVIKEKNEGGIISIGKEFARINRISSKIKNDSYNITVSIKEKSKGFNKKLENSAEKLVKEYHKELNFKASKVKITERQGI